MQIHTFSKYNNTLCAYWPVACRHVNDVNARPVAAVAAAAEGLAAITVDAH
jgi:hypothetical protein